MILLPQVGFTKTSMPQDWKDLISACEGHITTFYDRDQQRKQAASDLFSRKEINELTPPKGYFGIHQNIMGSEEAFGFNQNGDSYPADMLTRDHPTFVSHGKVYREHRNKRPDQAIGEIKAAKFSKEQQRVELFKWVKIAKAEKEYEMAKAGKELHASQSCRVPGDICSICSHMAKSAAAYCDDLRDHLGQWVPSRKKYAFARNPKCTFFDSSIVENPADRTAKHIEYRFGPEALKAASAVPHVLSGADWANFTGADQMKVLDVSAKEAALIRKLAMLERNDNPDFFYTKVASCAFAPDASLPQPTLTAVRALQPGTFFRKLARLKILLPFDAFTSYACNTPIQAVREDVDYKQASLHLPQVFRALADALEGGGSCCGGDMEMFRAAGHNEAAWDGGSSDAIDQALEKAAPDVSVDTEPLHARVIKITVTKVKKAAAEQARIALPNFSRLGLLYGLYKVAAIQDILAQDADYSEERLCQLAIAQNEPEKL